MLPWWIHLTLGALIGAGVAATGAKGGLVKEGLMFGVAIFCFSVFFLMADISWTKAIRAASGRQRSFLWACTYGSPLPAAIMSLPLAGVRAFLVIYQGSGGKDVAILASVAIGILMLWPPAVEMAWRLLPPEDEPAQQWRTERRGA